MKTSEFREKLLVSLLLTAQQRGLSNYLDPREDADRVDSGRRLGQLRLVVRDLENRGLVDATYGLGEGEEGGINLHLTNAGVEEAEELLERHPEYALPATSSAAPAADRYVAFSDNQRVEIKADVEKVRSAVQSANDVEDEDRQIALSELAIFEATIVQPRVSSELIDRFANRILAWICSKFGEGLIAAIAGALTVKLLPFLAT